MKVFERNKVPLRLRFSVLQPKTSSVRRAARILSELHPVSLFGTGL
ncbi:MAG: hypothetical protein ACXQTD_00065 [Candidatus Syntropharchaeia archaeon]